MGWGALRCWPHLGPTARVAKASSQRAIPGEAQAGIPIPTRVRAAARQSLLPMRVRLPPGQQSLMMLLPKKTPGDTHKSLPATDIMLTSRTSVQMQLRFNADAYSFVRKTPKHPCAFWPISSSPGHVKSGLNSFPGQKSRPWIVFVQSRRVNRVCGSPR